MRSQRRRNGARVSTIFATFDGMTVEENVDLLPFNTFRIEARARYFTTISTVEEAIALFQSDLFRSNRRIILGGGSNVLFTGDFDGLVVKNELKGIHVVGESDNTITLKVASGENWHQLVMYAVERDWGGIENLSLIPGTVGAAPMQNIGAYGVEIREVIDHVEIIELATGLVRQMNREECRFGYRESIFKHDLKDKVFISSITLTLTKKNHNLKTGYGAVTDVLRDRKVENVTVRAISEAIIEIRKKKLPDPDLIGNAGSFFKNPSISKPEFEQLKKEFPLIPSFAGENGLIKIPAAWLIEQCGWRGKTLENIGVHRHQALVLVNYGGGDGSKIWKLAQHIRRSVEEKFKINLHPEVNVI